MGKYIHCECKKIGVKGRVIVLVCSWMQLLLRKDGCHRLIQKEELGGSLVLIWFLFGFVSVTKDFGLVGEGVGLFSYVAVVI